MKIQNEQKKPFSLIKEESFVKELIIFVVEMVEAPKRALSQSREHSSLTKAHEKPKVLD